MKGAGKPFTVIEGDFQKSAEAHPAVIELLEEGCSKAKAEGAQFALIIIVDGDGNVIDGYQGGKIRPYVVVGALESLKRDFMNHEIQAR